MHRCTHLVGTLANLRGRRRWSLGAREYYAVDHCQWGDQKRREYCVLVFGSEYDKVFESDLAEITLV